MKYTIYILLILTFNCLLVKGQDNDDIDFSIEIKEISLVNVVPNNQVISFDVSVASTVGEEFPTQYNSSKWLNYTSTHSSYSPLKIIKAHIGGGVLPQGIALYLKVDGATGYGAGHLGIPTSKIKLNNSPQTVLSCIGGAYTGRGKHNGHRLNYSVKILDYEKLTSVHNKKYVVYYTLLED